MRSEAADRLTNSLFQKLCREKAEERIALRCPLCKDALEALQLNKDDKGYQTIWWICKSTLQQKCTFPSDIPTDVFWVERTPQQISEGFIPRPQLHQLPEEYRYLYPSLFPNSARNTPMTSVPTTRPTSAMSQRESDMSANSLHTRDMSLNSELASVASRPSGPDSVLVCDSPPRSQNGSLDAASLLVSGSGSSDAGLGDNSEALVPAPAPLVTKVVRKRLAEPLPLERVPQPRRILSIDALKIKMQKLYEEGVSDDQLMTIAEKALELQEDPSSRVPSHNFVSPAAVDDYVDMINQSLPVVTTEDARKAIKKKTFAEKMQLMYSLRKAKSGAEVFESVGLKGRPPPENNHWRSDSRIKVAELLDRVIRRRKEHERRLAEEVSRIPKRKLAKPDPTPSTSKEELEKEREKAELLELERKTQALIRSKMRANREAERTRLLQNLAVLEHQQGSNASVRSETPNFDTPPLSAFDSSPSMHFDPAPASLFDEQYLPPSPLDPSISNYYPNPYADPYTNQPSTSTEPNYYADPYQPSISTDPNYQEQDLFDLF